MRKKCNTLAAWTFVLAVVIFVLSFFVYHYVTPELTVTTVFQKEARKPFITQLLVNLGVLFLFGSVMSLLIGRIFFPEEKGKNHNKNI